MLHIRVAILLATAAAYMQFDWFRVVRFASGADDRFDHIAHRFGASLAKHHPLLWPYVFGMFDKTEANARLVAGSQTFLGHCLNGCGLANAAAVDHCLVA